MCSLSPASARRGFLQKEHHMKLRLIMIPILFTLFVLGTSPILLADEQCTLRSVAGDWAYTATGVRNPVGPAASVGLVHFDREGNVIGTQSLSINGTIVQ